MVPGSPVLKRSEVRMMMTGISCSGRLLQWNREDGWKSHSGQKPALEMVGNIAEFSHAMLQLEMLSPAFEQHVHLQPMAIGD